MPKRAPYSIYDRLSRAGKSTKDTVKTKAVWTVAGKRNVVRSRRSALPQGLWIELLNQTDVALYKPKLADHVEIKEFRLRWGNDYAIASNRRDLIFYRLDLGEVKLLRKMDGTATVAELVVDNLTEQGEFELSAFADLVRQLDYGGFLERPFIDVEKAITKAIAPPLSLPRRLSEFFRTLTIEWKGAERVILWLYRHGLRHVFKRWVQIVMAVLAALGLIAFFNLIYRSHFQLLDRSAAKEGLILVALGYTLTVIHETAHALVLIHHGRRVKSAGFFIYFGSTAAFIDSSDSLMLEGRTSIRMSFAGPYSEAIVAGMVAILAFLFPHAPFSRTLYKFALLNYYVIFLNLVPFLELDGYWIFANAIQMPDLRKRSLLFLRHELWRKIKSRERLTRMQVGFAIYGVLGIAFTIFWVNASFYFWRRIFGGIVSSLWNGGLISRLLLFTLALVILGPIMRAITGLGRSIAKRLRDVYRTIRFRLEHSWRIEAAEMISSLSIFDELDEESLNDLAGRVNLMVVRSGTSVVLQGQPADAFYIVRMGTFEVIEEDPESDNQRVLRVLGRGEAFGELGLATGSPRRATVRASEDSQVFQIDKGTFDRLLVDAISIPDFAPTIQSIRELKQLPCFSHLESDEISELLSMGEWVDFEPQEIIIKQGAPGDAFYAMTSGKTHVIRNRKVIATQEAGSFFGEVALLLDIPRTATVKALTPVRAFKVTRRGFNKLLKNAFKKGTLDPQTPVQLLWEH